jgi:hypothetical protein
MRLSVYANPPRMQRPKGSPLHRPEALTQERSFAHVLKTWTMRTVSLRARLNVWKRNLIHACEFNLALVVRPPAYAEGLSKSKAGAPVLRPAPIFSARSCS